MKILSFLVTFASKVKTADILNFLSVKFRQKFVVSENLTYLSQLLLKLRTVELAISFFSANAKIYFFES